MTQQTQQAGLPPLAVSSDKGEARWWFGMLVVIKTTAAETGGQLSIIEVTNPPGYEAPLHVHHRDDEGFWILEGSATIEVGDTTIEVSAGDYAFGPRDVPHRRPRRNRTSTPSSRSSRSTAMRSSSSTSSVSGAGARPSRGSDRYCATSGDCLGCGRRPPQRPSVVPKR
jgi:mannose-6-phosphate isomerase-like protein (cupin superfamily)